MTEWALKWETHGCKTAKRRLVENAKQFKELPTLVGDLMHPILTCCSGEWLGG
ncbi:hypothetical protein QL093DRAFT_2478545 [Fusarium oxysporum]|nr:hypothetical protein QL093DRAFT_2478545 [Fusarium oxysporum]